MDYYNQEELFAETVLAAQNRADFVALELELSQPKFKGKDGGPSRRKIEPWCFPVSIIAFLVLLLICIPMFGNEKASDEINKSGSGELCNDTCRLSFHQGASQQWTSFEFNDTKHLQRSRWSDLMAQAKSSIDILTIYSTRENRLFEFLGQLSVHPMVRIRIILLIQNADTAFDVTSWLTLMSELDNQVEVRTLVYDIDMGRSRSLPRLLLVDQSYFSMSSTIFTTDRAHWENTWTLEAENCSCSSLAPDLQRVFQTFWSQGRNPMPDFEMPGQNSPSREKSVAADFHTTKPDPFDSAFIASMTMPVVASSSINVSTSFHNMDQRLSSGLSSAFPTEVLTTVEAICAVLHASRDFLYISIANYRPELSLDGTHTNSSHTNKRIVYWPVLDSALRAAFVSRDLDIRMMVQLEDSSVDQQYLRSLKALDGFRGNSLQIKTIGFSSGTVNRTQLPFVAGNIVVSTNATHFSSNSWNGDSLTKLPGVGFTILPPHFCQEDSHFCSVVRTQREFIVAGSAEKPVSGSRSSGSARSTAPPSHRHTVPRTPKDQLKHYPPPRLSSSQIELQASLIGELTTLFESQWDHPDAYGL